MPAYNPIRLWTNLRLLLFIYEWEP